MPRYRLLKHYTGGPTEPAFAPTEQWTHEEIDTHSA